MSLQLRRITQTRECAIRSLAASAITPYGRSGPYRRIHNPAVLRQITGPRLRPTRPSSVTSLALHLQYPTPSQWSSPAAIRRSFSSYSAFLQPQRTGPDVKDSPKEGSSAAEGAEAESDKPKQSSEGTKQESSKESEDGKKKEAPPPPPPHGDKTPWQVFTETLRTEFKASKEWNESTKALASSAHQFTENESVKRARAAYTAASETATSTTSSALKSTGKAIGQGAAWTWDTPVVKGVRAGVSLTGKGIDMATKPVRETKVYKKTVGSVKEVIDDGSSSRYGGWTEKEERRKQRELRELNESKTAGKLGKRMEKMEEDPEYGSLFRMPLLVTNVFEKGRNQRHTSQGRCMEGIMAGLQRLQSVNAVAIFSKVQL